MKKRLLTLLLLIALMLSASSISDAVNNNYSPPTTAPQDMVQAKADDNNYLGFPYFVEELPSGQKLRMEKYYGNEHVLVYGSPSGDFEQGQYRFLGVNDKGEKVTNTNFPNDEAPEGMLDDQNWVDTPPWKDKELKNYLKSKGEKIEENRPVDGDPVFLENIKTGLKLKLPAEYRGTPNVKWNRIVHILQPPTYYGWGVGRAWHIKADGSIWYRTIPIAPSKLVPKPQPPAPTQSLPPGNIGSPNGNDQGPDTGGKNNLKVVIIGTTSEAWAGSQVTVSAKVTNETGKLLTTDIVWKLNGMVISTDNKFDVITQANSSCKFTMPSTNANIEVTVNPNHNRPPDETSWADNISSTNLKPEQLQESQQGKISISISAPSNVEPNTAWTYTVHVKYLWTRPKGYKGSPPSDTVTLTTTGNGKISQGLDVNGQNISPIPVNRSYTKKFTITGGGSEAFSFNFPGTLMINESYYVILKANLDNGVSASEKVLIGPWPVGKPIPRLVK